MEGDHLLLPKLDIKVPMSVDWSAEPNNIAGELRNQGRDTVTCWAFVASANIASRYVQDNAPRRELSPQYLVNCCRPFETSPYAHSYVSAFKWMIDHDNGIPREEDCPYDMYKKNECQPIQPGWEEYKISKFTIIPNEEEERVIHALSEHPITAKIYITNEFIHLKDGIYSGSGDPSKGAHAVLIVGYDSDEEMGWFYKIKNSWGTNWGNGGYAKILMNSAADAPILTRFAYPDITVPHIVIPH